MMIRRGIWVLLLVIHCHASAQGVTEVVLPIKQIDYGPGKIPSSEAKKHENEAVVACGRASKTINSLNGINIGQSGLDGMVGADLILMLPDDIPNSIYLGKLLCVAGVVKMMPVNNSLPVPTITVTSRHDITVLPIH
ncbi:Uncharacterised protein [Legionella wadsworthii]|uniref:Secreted protein n=1 Tax=Legionella wadsworthii TaxID=28088 RepID=A0A378LNF7_9GAMM|nr:hypothetical protein [Legionella wadsworthii]STY28446.1 Uncharacterised protein [Legionella wadsworthii]